MREMLLICVVIYQKGFSDSDTLKSLSRQHLKEGQSAQLIVFDNSPASILDLAEFSEIDWLSNVVLRRTPENLSLREIYNIIIDQYPCCSLMLLDDDTQLPPGFVALALHELEASKDIDLFLPVISTYGKTYSPFYSFMYFSKSIKRISKGVHSVRCLGAINTGLIIRRSFLDETGFRYPQYCEFYGTDTVLLEHYRTVRSRVKVLDVVLEHDVNFHPSNPDVDRYITSLLQVCTFWCRHYRDRCLARLSYKFFIFMFLVKLSFVKKSFSYFLKFYDLE